MYLRGLVITVTIW